MTATAPHWTTIDWSEHTRTTTIARRAVTYVDYGHGDDVVLLVHGLGGSWQSWLENIPTLGEHHRVVAVDLAGFGGSDPLGDDGSIYDHVETLTGLLDVVGCREAVVVGHSLGGLVTLCLSLWQPHRVRGTVLVSGGGVPLSPFRLSIILTAFHAFSLVFSIPGVARTVAARAGLRRLLLWVALDDWRTMSPELAAIAVPLMNAPGFAATARAAAAALPAVRPDLVTTPTLLVWGRNDRILPLDAAEEMVAQLRDAELVSLDHVGHCAMFEAPGRVNELLLSFLGSDRLRPARTAEEGSTDERTG